jgi:hypothetical protein
MKFKPETLRLLLGIFLSGFGVVFFKILDITNTTSNVLNYNILLFINILILLTLGLANIIIALNLLNKGG